MFYKKCILGLMLIAGSIPAYASMTISGTRVIFPAAKKEVSVRTNNKGTDPALVQIWVDDGKSDANINNLTIPFVVTPPVFRVEAGKGQSVRMIYNGMALPQDKESVFWFNMLEVPTIEKNSGDKNKLELAFRTRIKIFYRPTTLNSSGTEQSEKLQWVLASDSQKGQGVKVTNPTPYYFSFDSGIATAGSKKVELKTEMLAPFSTLTFYPENKISGISAVVYKILNDYGAPIEESISFTQGKGTLVKK
ncbi:fimbria/pilus periplasmic chaperone [Yersinia mollaretii]|uniref:Pili chaperone protein n=1 Tax=Yersinia mollaretii TaxID=33060 RepID=A0AA36PMX3_YERMO|nr:fimbria/pilus periplasmic chaperone [Yersinia mollaretii]MDA5527683.1 fimbria/pilus periplasmic chaperone [Yersinia mollaretii]MDA5536545.1 fimbria/pilus periplasmic chaperone [Yersinia mollaretii]MDR7873844.1 fimbria/pilus periplasmic chaperone [Yersinia mollaretii]NIL04081.1 fimbria/pilus periplasmic chaperone [Yersinia mollaretii]PHZ31166.1 pilus assembly protein [Yersinia mollaretii]